VLLLLDVWPLERVSFDAGFQKQARRLTVEKLPLILLAAGSLVLTLAAQQQISAVAAFEALPLRIRLSNAAISYLAYIGKMLWPRGLTAFYPYRESLPIAVVVACVTLLGVLSAAALAAVRRAPYVTVGWLWYVGTLVPVIGIVQIGGHAMADRFTYIPLIGLFIVLVWGGTALLSRIAFPSPLVAVVGATAIVACATAARGQVWHWRDGISLWEHATRVSRDNARAHANLGVALARNGQRDPAMAQYREGLRLDPRMAETHNNLALAEVDAGARDDAIAHYIEAVRLKPDYPNAHTNLANLLDEQGRSDEAIQHYREAIRLKPDHVLARTNLAIALARVGRVDEAIAQLEEALRADPSYGPARRVLDEIRRLSPTS
jgi:tetratricopeptide (TPR) repeat protein